MTFHEEQRQRALRTRDRWLAAATDHVDAQPPARQAELAAALEYLRTRGGSFWLRMPQYHRDGVALLLDVENHLPIWNQS